VTQSTLLLSLLGLMPFVLLATTSFAKLTIVFGLLRNALGAGDIPSGAVVIVAAGLLSAYVMLPVGYAVHTAVSPTLSTLNKSAPLRATGGRALWSALDHAKEPLRAFLDKNAGAVERETFSALLKQRLPAPEAALVSDHDLAVVMPAFFITELKEALQMGFLLLLPFLVLDLLIASMLGALGMQHLPLTYVALPFKLLLFVSVDGFRTLAEALVQGYA